MLERLIFAGVGLFAVASCQTTPDRAASSAPAGEQDTAASASTPAGNPANADDASSESAPVPAGPPDAQDMAAPDAEPVLCAGEHPVGEAWKVECNTCRCMPDAQIACTRMACTEPSH